jgi:hypothetical protein
VVFSNTHSHTQAQVFKRLIKYDTLVFKCLHIISHNQLHMGMFIKILIKMIRCFPVKKSTLRICPLTWFLTCFCCCCCYDDDVFALFVAIITLIIIIIEAAAEVIQNWGQTCFSYVYSYYLSDNYQLPLQFINHY